MAQIFACENCGHATVDTMDGSHHDATPDEPGRMQCVHCSHEGAPKAFEDEETYFTFRQEREAAVGEAIDG